MNTTEDYQGCRIFIHDKNGKDVACTTITEHKKDFMIITVNGIFNELINNDYVTLLIITSSNVYEYRGTLRGTSHVAGTMDFALYKGHVKKTRAATRYPINTNANVKHLVIKTNLYPLLNPIKVFIVNLSTSGALIRAKQNCFAMNAVIEIELIINGNTTMIYGRIVRIVNIDSTTSEYGCEFEFAK